MKNQSLDLREKYRPKRFADILGNKVTVQYLKNSASKSRTPSGLILHGPGGTGKTTCARVYSKALCCLNFKAVGDVCGECEACRSIEERYPDSSVTYGITIYDCNLFDEKSINDLIRNQLHFVHFNKIEKDIHIFDQFDLIRDRRQDKFLMQLETKPYLLFIFCLINISSIDRVFKDRTTVLKTTRPEIKEIVPWLERICNAEEIVIQEKEALEHLAKKADCVPRACLATLEKIVVYGESISVSLLRELSDDQKSVNDDDTNRRIID